MKTITIKRGLFVLAMALIVSGCTQGAKPDDGAGVEGGELEGGATVGTIGEGGALAGTALEGMKISYEKDAINDPENVLSIKTIYFDYDSSEIGDDNVEVITEPYQHHLLGQRMEINIIESNFCKNSDDIRRDKINFCLDLYQSLLDFQPGRNGCGFRPYFPHHLCRKKIPVQTIAEHPFLLNF